MTILLSGGGSGGHITPLLAVAAELKQLRPDVHIIFIGQRGDKLADIPAADKNIDEVYTVRAGKFRRYHGEGLKQILDIKTMLKNARDFFWVIEGVFQSRRLLKKLRPDIVFTRGGFVSVPVCLAAGQLHIPYVTHDSDAIPSLANRIVAKRATLHTVALPKEIYPYPQAKTFTVGVPVTGEYQLVTQKLQQQYRHELGLDKFNRAILITGGGNGAQDLNEAGAAMVPELLARYSDLVILHIVGRDHETTMQQAYDAALTPEQRQQVVIKGFVTDLYRYSGVADVVIARAGATNMAEFAIQGKACVIVPNALLTGGHQVKNAEVLAKQGAIKVISETQLAAPDGIKLFTGSIEELLDSPTKRKALGKQLATFGHPQAARELAELLLKTVS